MINPSSKYIIQRVALVSVTRFFNLDYALVFVAKGTNRALDLPFSFVGKGCDGYA